MRRTDSYVCAALALVTLAVCLYFAPRGHHFGFVDMGQDGYQLRQAIDLSRGKMIFRDTFDQYGPLNGYLNTAGFVMFGRRLLAIKYFVSLWYAVIAAMLYLTARRWLSPALATFSSLLWLALAPFYQHGIMISPHVYVLFLQASAVLLVLWATPERPAAFAIAGVLAGLSWGMKQSIGTLFLLALLLFLLLYAVTRRNHWIAAAKSALVMTGGFAVVVSCVLAFLWHGGALHDWYLQTIAFPRMLYVTSLEFSSLVAPARTFVELQWQAAGYWWVIRLVVIAGGIVALRRSMSPDFLLLGCVTGVLWIGAYPSANFMHQWWTTGLTFAPFVACLSIVVGRVVRTPIARSVVTAVVALAIVVFGIGERVRATRARALDLTETIAEPAAFRGIHTSPHAKRVFDGMSRRMAQYRTRHPGARIVSIEASTGGESLPFLEFFDDNDHSQPMYWSEPGLADTIYADYLPTFWKEVDATHPLIVNHLLGAFKLQAIPNYSVVFVAPADFGYWYLYAPDSDDLVAKQSHVFLDADGSEIALPPGDAAALAAVVERPNNWNVHGGLREHRGSVDVYTWPPELALTSVPPAGTPDPVSDRPFTRAGAVTRVEAGAWTVGGRADDRYSYLLQFPAVPREKGSYFVAQGELRSGGFTIGLTRDSHWYGVVNITQPGPFLFVMQMQSAGSYELTVANCIESQMSNTLGLVTTSFLRNDFTVTHAGWIRP